MLVLQVALGNVPRGVCLDPRLHYKRSSPRLSAELPADGVEGVTGGAKDGAELRGAFPEAFQVVLAVVKDHAAVGVVDAVIEVVAELAATDGLADDLGHGGGS